LYCKAGLGDLLHIIYLIIDISYDISTKYYFFPF